MRPTLRQLELFIALADAKTMSAAAAELHISESALSHAITQLEKSFGTQLCLRKKARGVSLTPAGHAIAAEAAEILQRVDDLMSTTAAEEGRIVGAVKVGCFDALASLLLPALMERMLTDYPELNFEVTLGRHDELVEKVSQGQLHFAFLWDQSLPAHFKMVNIYEAEEMVLIRDDHPFAQKSSISYKELEPEPFVIINARNSMLNSKNLFAQHNAIPNIVAAVPDIELVYGLVERGLAYSILMSRPLVNEDMLGNARLVFKPLQPRPEPRCVVAVWSSDSKLPLRAKKAIDFTRQRFANIK